MRNVLELIGIALVLVVLFGSAVLYLGPQWTP